MSHLPAGRICFLTPELLASEADGGAGLRLVVGAALGATGILVSTEQALRSDLAKAVEDMQAVVVCGAQEKARALARSLPERCEVWRRAQLVQAIVQQTFVHQKPLCVT